MTAHMDLYLIIALSVICFLIWLRIDIVLSIRIKETDTMIKFPNVITDARLERLKDNNHVSMLLDWRKWKYNQFFPRMD